MFRSVGELAFGKCAIKATVFVENRVNGRLEDLVGGRLHGDRPVVIGMKRGLIFFGDVMREHF